MEAIADLAERFSFDEIRVSHEQNLVLPHVRLTDLAEVWEVLAANGLGTPNAGLLSDIIACPGLDYCNLANARSIPVAQRLTRSEEHTSELPSLMRHPYAVFCLKKKTNKKQNK